MEPPYTIPNMSAYDNGKCDHCGKANLRATVKIQIHDIPGTLGNENRCLQCVRGQGYENSGIESSKWPNTQLIFSSP
jgi:hypothetical protein